MQGLHARAQDRCEDQMSVRRHEMSLRIYETADPECRYVVVNDENGVVSSSCIPVPPLDMEVSRYIHPDVVLITRDSLHKGDHMIKVCESAPSLLSCPLEVVGVYGLDRPKAKSLTIDIRRMQRKVRGVENAREYAKHVPDKPVLAEKLTSLESPRLDDIVRKYIR